MCYVCSFPHKNVRFNVSVNTQLIFYNSWGRQQNFWQVGHTDVDWQYNPPDYWNHQLTHNSFFITLGGDNKTFDKLATLMLTGSTTHQITGIIMQCQPLRNAVKFLFLKNVNVQCQSNLCNRSPEKSSVLLTPPTQGIEAAVNYVPDVLYVLAAIAVLNVKDNSEQQIASLCTAYGILMFT